MPTNFPKQKQRQNSSLKQTEVARQEEVQAIILAIREQVTLYQLTERDIFPRRRKSTSALSPPKYRHPETGETWSGRGRAPAWMDNKNRERFLIKS